MDRLDPRHATPTGHLEGSSRTCTLGDLAPGARARVVRLGAAGDVSRRIADMGVTAGTEVTVERVAPLGDPIQIRVRGYHLSLRLSEADQVEVEPV